MEDGGYSEHPDGEGEVEEDGDGDDGDYEIIECFVECVGYFAVSEEEILEIEVSECDCNEAYDRDDWHPSRKGHPHENYHQQVSIVTLKLKLRRLHSPLHIRLHLLPSCSPKTNFLHQVKYQWHWKAGMDSHREYVQCQLITDL